MFLIFNCCTESQNVVVPHCEMALEPCKCDCASASSSMYPFLQERIEHAENIKIIEQNRNEHKLENQEKKKEKSLKKLKRKLNYFCQ